MTAWAAITALNYDTGKISQEELLRLFQESGKLYADEMIIHYSSANDIDKELFYAFYAKLYGENIEAAGMPLLYNTI